MIICKKIQFETKKEAKKALKKVSRQPLYLKGKFIKKARKYYKCSICNKYHITSQK